MDRALKERIVGAVVLVAFAVLIVPVFLDGSVESTQTVTEVVTLPGQNDQPRKQQTIVLERDRNDPVPAVQTKLPAKEPAVAAESPTLAPEKPPVKNETRAEKQTAVARAQTEPADKKAAPEKAPSPQSKPTEKPAQAASATGMWAVQLGSFSNRDNAERLAANLRGEGYAAFLSRLGTDGGELHRVRIGPQKNRDDAESVAAKLTDSGHQGQVVPHP